MKPTTVVLLVLCCISVCLGAVWQPVPPTSSSAPPVRYHQAFASVNDTLNLYIAGFDFSGPGGSGVYLSDVWSYNANTSAWAKVAGLSNGRAFFTAVTYHGQVVIYAGVGPGDYPYDNTLRYSFSTNAWAVDTYRNLNNTVASALARQWHASVVVGNKMYVFGGHAYYKNRSANDLIVYNLDTNEWEILIPDGMPGPARRQGHTLNFFNDPSLGPSLILFGGYSDNPHSEGFADAWQFVIKDSTWHELSSLGSPAGRYSHDSVLINSTLYIYGGLNTLASGTDIYYGDVWALHLNGGLASKWVSVIADTASGPGRRQGHQAAVFKGSFYTFSGYVQYVGLVNDVWSLQF